MVDELDVLASLTGVAMLLSLEALRPKIPNMLSREGLGPREKKPP
jgi:hypothetical protein